MNNVYRVIWNAGTRKWVMASEKARSYKKHASLHRAITLSLAVAAAGMAMPTAFAESALENNDALCAEGEHPAEGGCASGPAPSIGPRYAAGGGDDGNGGNNASRVAIGSTAVVGADNAVGIGSQLTVNSAGAVAFGTDYFHSGNRTAAVDANSAGAFVVNGHAANSANSVALLGHAAASPGSVAIGYNASVWQSTGVAIGQDSMVYGTGAIAIGSGAVAAGQGNIALGANSSTDFLRSNVVSVGNATTQRQIINVAAGTADTDAVNVAQMNTAIGRVQKAGTAYFQADGLGDGTDDAKATGTNAVAAGSNAQAVSASSVALGTGAQASGDSAIALGHSAVAGGGGNAIALGNGASALGGGNQIAIGAGATTSSYNAIAIGLGSDAGMYNSIALGTGAKTAAFNSIAIGLNSLVRGQNAIAIGTGAAAYFYNSTAIGFGAVSEKEGDVALGHGAHATGITGGYASSANAIGTYANANGWGAIAMGQSSNANAGFSTSVGSASNVAAQGGSAFGYAAKVTADAADAIALGTNSVADRANTVSVGSAGNERQITNVAAGTEDTDAVNVAQLKQAGLVGDDGSTLDAVTYAAGTDRGMIMLGGLGGTTIANVMAGAVAPGSMDAINGSQLWDVQNQVNQLGDRVTGIEQGAVSPVDPPNPIGTVTDNGGQIIGNVGDGVAPTDAATVGQVSAQTQEAIQTANNYTDQQVGALSQQVDQFKSSVDRRFQAQDERISRVGAMSAAYAQMSFSAQGIDTPNRLGVGVGTQSGHSAIAVGYSRNVSKNVNLSFGGSASGSETSGGVGLGVGW